MDVETIMAFSPSDTLWHFHCQNVNQHQMNELDPEDDRVNLKCVCCWGGWGTFVSEENQQ
jgi:hypothetical protein